MLHSIVHPLEPRQLLAAALSVNDASITEGHLGTALLGFVVTLSEASSTPVTVNYATSDVTATANSDYLPASGQLLFPQGVTSKPVIVTVNGDQLPEVNETFKLLLSNPVGATIADGEGIGTIIDDDPKRTLTIKDAWVIEGDNPSLKPFISFFASIGQASSNPVTFHYQTFDATAKAGTDYVASSGDVTFAANETKKEILIPTFADTAPEANKTFKLVITGVTNAIPERSEIIGTIFDNDGQSETRMGALTPTSATNGWGPFEVNQSNGETRAGDGRPITFPGGVMPYGLGVHANSDLRYNLAGKYSRFSASVGVDAEVHSSGSVVFEVKLDGLTVYQSDIMRGNQAPEMIAIDVTGKNSIDLIVTDAGDGKNYDHADWGNASLFGAGTTPTPSTTYLSDLTPVSATNGWGAYERDRSNGELGSSDGRTLKLNGQTYAKGLGVHARSELVFNVPTGANRFQSDIGIDDEIVQVGSVIFKVFNGSNLLFSSTRITGSSATQSVDLSVVDMTQLKLVVEDAGDGKNYDHADWAMARFVK
jgi:hypothetical protein